MSNLFLKDIAIKLNTLVVIKLTKYLLAKIFYLKKVLNKNLKIKSWNKEVMELTIA